MTRITDVTAWEALDSRGNPTVACQVTLAGGARGVATVPSGASTGMAEVFESRDGGDRYGGRGVRRAVAAVVDELQPAVQGLDATDQAAVDAALRAADGTPTLERLGGNAVLAVSVATARAGASARGLPVWQALSGPEPVLPLPMVNVVSGGAHAGRVVDIQDVLVIPVGASRFSEAIEWAWRVRRGTADVVRSRGLNADLVADEGGLGPALPTNRDALAIVVQGAEQAGLKVGEDVVLAVDVAANQFHRDGRYHLAAEDRQLDASEMIDEVAAWCDDFPLASIEDLLADDDWDGWAEASRRLGDRVQLLGDDLFATNPQRLERGIDQGIANAVLVKPNQVGTLSDAAATVRRAHAAGYATVVSARSGETEDAWLADLAIGWGPGQIKVGSTMRSDRTAKWNRLLQIEHELGDRARFAGAAVLAGHRTDAVTASPANSTKARV